MAGGAYLILCLMPRDKSARYATIYVALYMSYQNMCTLIYKYDDRSIDASWSTMVLCAKMHGLAFAL